MRALLVVFCLFWTTGAQAMCGLTTGSADNTGPVLVDSVQLINTSTQVALMRLGEQTMLSMRNDDRGLPHAFALVVVLEPENVKILPADVFDRIDRLSAPRLEAFWAPR